MDHGVYIQVQALKNIQVQALLKNTQRIHRTYYAHIYTLLHCCIMLSCQQQVTFACFNSFKKGFELHLQLY